MRDAILTLLCAAQEAMSITDIAAAVRPGADATIRSSVGKTLNRMKQLGEVENVAPGMFRAVLSSRAA
jgi:Fe2+ or Zn2+ uptake regulation protein